LVRRPQRTPMTAAQRTFAAFLEDAGVRYPIRNISVAPFKGPHVVGGTAIAEARHRPATEPRRQARTRLAGHSSRARSSPRGVPGPPGPLPAAALLLSFRALLRRRLGGLLPSAGRQADHSRRRRAIMG